MPLDYAVSTLKTAVSATDSAIVKALKYTRDSIAPIYKNDPGWFTNPENIEQAGNLLPGMGRQLMDDLLSDKPLPPAVQKPFSDGQCACVNYSVTLRTDFFNADGSFNSFSTFTQTLPGAIGGLSFTPQPTQTQPDYVQYYLYYGVGCATQSVKRIGAGAGQLSRIRVSITSVSRVGGGASCGDPYARDPIAINPPQITFNVNIPDIRISPTGVFVVPVILVRPTLSLNLSPNFNMKLNLGGINFTFNGESFYQEPTTPDFTTINTSITNSQTAIQTSISNSQTAIINNTNSGNTSLRTNINTDRSTALTSTQTSINNSTQTSINNSQSAIISSLQTSISNSQSAISNLVISSNNSLTSQITNLSGKLDIQTDLLTDIKNKPDCPGSPTPPTGTNPPPPDKPEDNGGKGSKPKVTYLEIVLTKLPNKAQFGNSGETVFFAGWVAFRFESGGYTERQQINFQRSLFIAPAGSSGYTYTLTNGAKGYALVYTQ